MTGKQHRHWSDVTFCCTWSGSTLFGQAPLSRYLRVNMIYTLCRNKKTIYLDTPFIMMMKHVFTEKKKEKKKKIAPMNTLLFLTARICVYIVRRMDTPERFCCHFTKGDNFLRQEVASLVSETFLKWWLLLLERICSQREQILSFKTSPQKEGRQIFPS